MIGHFQPLRVLFLAAVDRLAFVIFFVVRLFVRQFSGH